MIPLKREKCLAKVLPPIEQEMEEREKKQQQGGHSSIKLGRQVLSTSTNLP
jgi:hypothetical protein